MKIRTAGYWRMYRSGSFDNYIWVSKNKKCLGKGKKHVKVLYIVVNCVKNKAFTYLFFLARTFLFIYLFIILFIQYFQRVALLASIASLPSGPL